MITLTILDLKTKKKKIKIFNSLDKAKKEGRKTLTSPTLKLAGASYDTNDEKVIVESLLKEQESQEGHSR